MNQFEYQYKKMHFHSEACLVGQGALKLNNTYFCIVQCYLLLLECSSPRPGLHCTYKYNCTLQKYTEKASLEECSTGQWCHCTQHKYTVKSSVENFSEMTHVDDNN